MQSENAILRQQAHLATQLEAEKDLLVEKSQQVAKMKTEMVSLKEKAVEFQDVFQYYIALKECADQVSKLKAANKALEKTTKTLPDLKKHNDELKRGSVRLWSVELMHIRIRIGKFGSTESTLYNLFTIVVLILLSAYFRTLQAKIANYLLCLRIIWP